MLFEFQGEATVSALCAAVGLNISMGSHHLSILLESGIVKSRKDGRFVYYSLNPDVVQNQDGRLIQRIDLGACIIDLEPRVPVVELGNGSPRLD